MSVVKAVPKWFADNHLADDRTTKQQWESFLGGLREPRFHGVTFKGAKSGPIQMGTASLVRAVYFEAPGHCFEIIPDPYMAAWNDRSPAAALTGSLILEYAVAQQEEYPDRLRPHLPKQPAQYSRYGSLFSERILSRVPSGEWDLTLDTVIRWLNAVEEVAPSDPRSVTASGNV